MTIPNRPSLADMMRLPLGEAASLPVEMLALLQEEAEQTVRLAKMQKDWLDGALTRRYATVANRDARSMRSFTVPWIPHDDSITPQDVQGVRGFGVADAADPLATVMERKLTRMRSKHAQTREFMEVNALKGVVRDGAGSTLYDYFAEFDLSRQQVDFALGTAATNVQAKIREVLRKVEVELKGETMTSVLALVSPEFFDKLIGHAKVEQAYQYFSSTGAQPLREDVRRRFPFAGMVFEEYSATVTLSTGQTETLIPPPWYGGPTARWSSRTSPCIPARRCSRSGGGRFPSPRLGTSSSMTATASLSRANQAWMPNGWCGRSA
ncbi:major capsid protein [Magnetospirillum sp. SS-4]|uniref:major capsid protein n=1 Tax=Magnetospirillum sp. SS-4 TaxID=2681465 RepID=UPI00137D1B22|nr:major capsid protein [Magnetospirillum sp. SS-4]CAA7622117.1 hypothetical protein MTBSS4_320039 [Magnetospirillum sp. SS-4]